MATPAVSPVATPVVEEMVSTVVGEQLHVPPVVASDMVPGLPTQSMLGPVIGAWPKVAKQVNNAIIVRLRCFIYFLFLKFTTKL